MALESPKKQKVKRKSGTDPSLPLQPGDPRRANGHVQGKLFGSLDNYCLGR